ncbi:MAG: serine dehydratase beta chain [Luteolibacter sp.]
MPSALDMFTIGIGPSSSHTVGPMHAAREFVLDLQKRGLAERVARVRCDTYGSLAATGKGHGTDKALILGFLGQDPECVDVDAIDGLLAEVATSGSLTLPWGTVIPFNAKEDLDFKRLKPLPLHPNGMHFQAYDAAGTLVGKTSSTRSAVASSPQRRI